MSEVLFSYIKQNDISRIDSQFYKKIFLNQENIIIKLNHKSLIQLGNQILSFGAYSLNNHITYKDKGIPFIRGVNLKNGRIDLNDVIYINNQENKLLWKSEVKPLTILLSMSGTIGDIAIACDNLSFPMNSNQDIAKIHPSNNINPFYLFSFLRSKFGQNYLLREARGSVQQHVFLSQIEKFQIPIFSDIFEKEVEINIIKSNQYFSESQQLYTQAEDLLLAEVGLKDFSPSTEAVNIKSFSESFGTSGRLDAEYYQKKYDDYLNMIYQYNNGYEILSTACKLKDTNYTPMDEKQYQYIELSNIGNSGDINGYTLDFGKELPSRARRKVNTGNVIISSIEGSLGSCALVTEKYNNALCSTGFYVLKSEKINPETLLVLFKSEILQAILKQNCSGTILTAINKNEFLNIPLPIIPLKKQQQIAQLVEQSFVLKARSEQLLEVAKRAVEIAIEQDEATAIAYITEESKIGNES